MERELAGGYKVGVISVENARSNCQDLSIVSLKMPEEHSPKSIILTHEDPQLLQINFRRN